MHVIWRDTFIATRPMPGSQRKHIDFLEDCRARLIGLPPYKADRYSRRHDQTDLLRVMERASRNVARIGYDSLVRYQFDPITLTDIQPTLNRLRIPPASLTQADILEAAEDANASKAWLRITPMLLLHRAGVGIMEYIASWEAPDPGLTPDEAVTRVRLGINTHLLRLPDPWIEMLPEDRAAWSIFHVIPNQANATLAVMGLRDISQIMAGLISSEAKKKRGVWLPALPASRPTGSTTVIIERTSPPASDDFPAFVHQHALPLRGIGAMDSYYRERAAWIVERELDDNLSVDSEAAVYLLGSSELILFNDHLAPLIPETRKRIGLNSDDLAVSYLYMHNAVLMEWIYLQTAILRSYLQKLDALAASSEPRRKVMIATLQGALADLVQYQESITPFATRIEFLERARTYHKIQALEERFEHKQELLLNYASEFHDFREARASEFLNWLAGILTGAALANLVITLAGITPDQTQLYLGITLGSIALVLALLWAIKRVV
jgi:hypothetical protein